MKPRIIVIGGPTASGKSELAIKLAELMDGELVCADSLTIYRGLDIGSAKPCATDLSRVPHHLLDIRNPTDPFTAADFRLEASNAISDILTRGKLPLVVGGTGLYLRILLGGLIEAPGSDPALRARLQQQADQEGGEALLARLQQVDPISAARCHPNNLVRIIRALEVWHHTGRPLSDFQQQHGFQDGPYHARFIWLNPPRAQLYERIGQRVDRMLASGLVDEVRSLLAAGVPADVKPLQAIGYKEVVSHLAGTIDIQEMANQIKLNTRHFAKRQITWFKAESTALPVAYPQNSASIESIAAMLLREGELSDVQNPLQHSGPVP